MIARWHSGESSHPEREALAKMYRNDHEGAKKLQDDLFAIKSDPMVMAADLQLRLVKYQQK